MKWKKNKRKTKHEMHSKRKANSFAVNSVGKDVPCGFGKAVSHWLRCFIWHKWSCCLVPFKHQRCSLWHSQRERRSWFWRFNYVLGNGIVITVDSILALQFFSYVNVRLTIFIGYFALTPFDVVFQILHQETDDCGVFSFAIRMKAEHRELQLANLSFGSDKFR